VERSLFFASLIGDPWIASTSAPVIKAQASKAGWLGSLG
jgi:hypothetical protein